MDTPWFGIIVFGFWVILSSNQISKCLGFVDKTPVTMVTRERWWNLRDVFYGPNCRKEIRFLFKHVHHSDFISGVKFVEFPSVGNICELSKIEETQLIIISENHRRRPTIRVGYTLEFPWDCLGPVEILQHCVKRIE